MQGRFKYSIILIVSLLLVLFFELIFLFTVPVIMNHELGAEVLVGYLKRECGIDLKLAGLRFETNADFTIDIFTDDVLIEDVTKKPLLKAKKVAAQIALFPLIVKKIDIKNLSADLFYVDIGKDGQGKLHFAGFGLDDGSAPQFDFKLKNAKLKLAHYDILFTDKEFDKIFRMKGDYLRIDELSPNFIDLRANGILTSSGEHTEFDITLKSKLPADKLTYDDDLDFSGYVQGIRPQMFLPYLKKYVQNDILQADGVVSLSFGTKQPVKGKKLVSLKLVAEDFALVMKNKTDTIFAHGKTTFDANTVVDKSGFALDKGILLNDKYKIVLSGFYKKPRYEIVMAIPYGRTESVLGLIPAHLPDDGIVRKMKKYGLYGDASGQIKIMGDVNSKRNPHLSGAVNAKNVYVVDKYNDVGATTLGIALNDDTLYVSSLVVAKDKEFVDVQGSVKVFDPKTYADFKIKSSKNVELSSTMKILMPIHDTFQFELGPLPIMTLPAGRGNIDLHARGNADTGEAFGYFNFMNAMASFNGLNNHIKNGYGELLFKGKDIVFRTKSANIDGAAIGIHGVANIDGDIDFDVTVPDAKMTTLLHLVRTSEMLVNEKKYIEQIADAQGICDFKMKLKGRVNELFSAELIESLNPRIVLKLKGGEVWIKGVVKPFKSVTGDIDVNSEGIFADLKVSVNSSILGVKGKLTDYITDFKFNSHNILLQDIMAYVPESQEFKQLKKAVKGPMGDMTLTGSYRAGGDLNNIDLNKLTLDLRFQPKTTSKDILSINSGFVKLDKGILFIDKLNAKLHGVESSLSGKVEGVVAGNPVYDVTFKSDDINLDVLNEVKDYRFMPVEVREALAYNKSYAGRAALNVDYVGNKLYGTVKLTDVAFVNKASSIPFKAENAYAELEGNRIKLSNLKFLLGNVPYYASVTVSDLNKKPKVSAYYSGKLTEELVDNYLNTNRIYPIKLKGSALLSGKLLGSVDNLRLKTEVKIPVDVDVSYMGTILGDVDDEREIKLDANFRPKTIVINRFEYNKNADTRPVGVVFAKGVLKERGQEFYIEGLDVQTLTEAPARLFNILFKKSILKDGKFVCDLHATGAMQSLKLTGTMNFNDVDVPLYNTTIQDINLKLDKELTYANFKMHSYDSDVLVNAVVKNKIELPVRIVDINLYSKKLDIDKMLNTIGEISLESYNKVLLNPNTSKPVIDFADVKVEKASIKADDVVFKGLPAKNFHSQLSFNNSVLSFDNVVLDIGTGKVIGNIKYNFKNDEIAMALAGKGVDANLISSALFNAQGQIYGNLDGEFRAMTKGANEEERLKNLAGFAYFELNDGKMPKLGSLEYLLKAGNLVKSGLTGVTLNNLIQLIIPTKTGYFTKIKGNLVVTNGVASNVQIYSKGDNLSIFVNGTYDLVNEYADMNVIGRLSKKASTPLGPFGNASLNTLFNFMPGLNLDEVEKAKLVTELNKIPGIDLNDQSYRVFKAKIDGNINSDNYVSSFKWVEGI